MGQFLMRPLDFNDTSLHIDCCNYKVIAREKDNVDHIDNSEGETYSGRTRSIFSSCCVPISNDGDVDEETETNPEMGTVVLEAQSQ